jgi:hypothetical protein
MEDTAPDQVICITRPHFLFQDACNQMQQRGKLRGGGAAGGAVSADFEAGYDDVELAVALDLALQAVEKSAFEFGDLAAAQAGHVDVVALGATFVKMFFALQVHEVELINQAVAFEEMEGAVDSDAIDLGINFAGFAEKLAGVEVLLGSFYDAEDGAALARHAQATGHQLGLEAARGFGFRERH